MKRKLLSLEESCERYGGKIATWRRWAWSGRLGRAVKHLGRRVMIDAEAVDSRLARIGQLLVDVPLGPIQHAATKRKGRHRSDNNAQ